MICVFREMSYLNFLHNVRGKHVWVLFVNYSITSYISRSFCLHLLSLAEWRQLIHSGAVFVLHSEPHVYSSAFQHIMSSFNYITPTMSIFCSRFCIAPSEFLLESHSSTPQIQLMVFLCVKRDWNRKWNFLARDLQTITDVCGLILRNIVYWSVQNLAALTRRLCSHLSWHNCECGNVLGVSDYCSCMAEVRPTWIPISCILNIVLTVDLAQYGSFWDFYAPEEYFVMHMQTEENCQLESDLFDQGRWFLCWKVYYCFLWNIFC